MSENSTDFAPDRRQPVMDTLTRFVGYMNMRHKLSASAAGLMLRDDDRFRRVCDGELSIGRRFYLGFSYPPIMEDEDEDGFLKWRKQKAISSAVNRLRKEWKENWISERKKPLLSRFSVEFENDRIYICVSPLLEAPEEGAKMLDALFARESRRGFMGAIYALAAGGIGYDGTRRVKETAKNNNVGDQVGGVLEIGGAALAARTAAMIGIGSLIRSVERHHPLLNYEMGDNQWRNFVLALRDQIKPVER